MSYATRTQFNPNNEIRVVLYPVQRKRGCENDVAQNPVVSPSVGLDDSLAKCLNSEPSTSYLDIRSEFRTDCSAHSHKRTRFGRDAATRIMRAGGALDLFDPVPGHYVFLTGTLPGDTDWAKWAIANYAHVLVDRLKSWLSKRLANRLEFYVWENQKRGALHLHYCCHIPEESVRSRVIAEFKDQWIRLLDGICEDSGVSVWGRYQESTHEFRKKVLQVYAQAVTKSVAAYMAGYCSSASNKHSLDDKCSFYPKRWFGVSRPLSSLIEGYSKTETKEFSRLREAVIHFEETSAYYEKHSDNIRRYAHNVGVGRTSISYHSAEDMQILWAERNPMKYNQMDFPVIAFYIRSIVKCCRTMRDLEMQSQQFRAFSSSISVEHLRDILYVESAHRYTLNLALVLGIKTLAIELCSLPNCPQAWERLRLDAVFCWQVYSQFTHLMLFDKKGWLVSQNDLPRIVDMKPENCYGRTTSQTEGETKGGDSYRGHVPSEPTPFLQPTLFESPMRGLDSETPPKNIQIDY